MLVAAITFAVVLAVIFGAYWFTVGEPEAREQRQLRRRLKTEGRTGTRATVQLVRQETALSNIGAFDALLQGTGRLIEPLRAFVGNSGLPLTVGTFLLLTATLFMAAGL